MGSGARLQPPIFFVVVIHPYSYGFEPAAFGFRYGFVLPTTLEDTLSVKLHLPDADARIDLLARCNEFRSADPGGQRPLGDTHTIGWREEGVVFLPPELLATLRMSVRTNIRFERHS